MSLLLFCDRKAGLLCQLVIMTFCILVLPQAVPVFVLLIFFIKCPVPRPIAQSQDGKCCLKAI